MSKKQLKKNTALLSEQDRLADGLFHSKWTIFGFFLLGLGLAFTPCVLPMLPLLSAIVIGQQQRPNMMRAFSLAFLYVQGMALTLHLVRARGSGYRFAVSNRLATSLCDDRAFYFICCSCPFNVWVIYYSIAK